MLAGHCTVGDFAIIGGGAAVHPVRARRRACLHRRHVGPGERPDPLRHGARQPRAPFRASTSSACSGAASRARTSTACAAPIGAVCRRGHAGWSAWRTWRRSSRTTRSSARSSPSSAPAANARCACRTPRRERCPMPAAHRVHRWRFDRRRPEPWPMTRIGILAGGGRLPLMIAESVVARGGGVHIVGIEGEADPGIARFPHTWVNWGQVGRMVATLRAEGGDELVIAGGVRRPDLWKHAAGRRLLHQPAADRGPAGGRRRLRADARGALLRGARASRCAARTRWRPTCWPGRAASAPWRCRAGRSGRRRARLCRAARAGPLDAGQAVVVARGEVLAIEGAEGTDAMLQRVAALPRRLPAARRGAACSPRDPSPARSCASTCRRSGRAPSSRRRAAGLAGIAVEAGAVLVLDRAEAVRAADAAGCAVHGLPAPGRLHVPQASRRWRVGRVIGRRRPSRRDAADIEQRAWPP